MTYIQPAKHVFFDTDGSVLQNGSVYIGQPDQDPRTNQKTVTFTDAGGSQFTASQPLSVLNGRISYNGRPIVAEVDGEHSILVLNSSGTQIDYTPSIVPPAASGGVTTDGIRYGLTLDAVKALDVAVGDVVRSVGSLTATDSLGADWLVTTATGSPGDDVDLIDFDNGLQGVRDTSKMYKASKLVWSGTSDSVLVSSISDISPGIYIVAFTDVISGEVMLLARRSLSNATPSVWGSSFVNANTGSGIHQFVTFTARITTDAGNPAIRVNTNKIEIDQSGPSFSTDSSFVTITAIYKML